MTEQGTTAKRTLLAAHLVAGVTVSIAGDGPDGNGLGRRRVCHRIDRNILGEDGELQESLAAPARGPVHAECQV